MALLEGAVRLQASQRASLTTPGGMAIMAVALLERYTKGFAWPY